MKVMRPLFPLALLALTVSLLPAETFIQPIVSCPRLSTPPVIDGRIDEPCWQEAAWLSNYLRPTGVALATEQTEAFIAHDAENLYLAFICHDSQIDKLVTDATQRDGNLWNDDCVEIYLDPTLTRLYYMQLIVNSRGVQFDTRITEISDTAWDIAWQSAGFVGEGFWSVELAIPFEQLGVDPPQPGTRWGINFNREYPRTHELSAWAPLGRETFATPSRFGDLVFTDTPGIGFAFQSLDKEDEAAVLVRRATDRPVQVELTTLAADGATASTRRDVVPDDFNQTLPLPLAFAPSAADFSVYATLRDTADERILYRSPPYPLPGEFFAPKLAQARHELDQLRARQLLLTAWMKLGRDPEGMLLTPLRPFDTPASGTLPDEAALGGTMQIFAAPDETEPATFLLYATRDLKAVTVSLPADLKHGSHRISRDQVDIRLLKSWYQSTSLVDPTSPIQLKAELLVHDDGILTADAKRQRNTLHFTGRPPVTDTLVPFSVSAYGTAQIWLTVRVPLGTPPGHYLGAVEVRADDATPQSIPIDVEVLPITLARPSCVFSMYYHNCIGGDSPVGAFPDAYEAELKDMAERGFSSVMIQEGVQLVTSNGTRRVVMDDLKRALDLRVKYGLTGPTIYSGFNWMTKETDRIFRKPIDQITAAEKETFVFIAKAIVDLVASNPAYPEFIFLLNVDEPGYDSTGAQLKLAALNCELLKQVGAKTATAITFEAAQKLGSLLDLAILDEPGVNRFYQQGGRRPAGRREYNYWHPEENPVYDRLRFGLIPWKTGIEGVIPWVYQWAVPRSWQEGTRDELQRPYRNLDYTYPAVGGLVPTIQWEGVREGIDDFRYLETLAQLVQTAEPRATEAKVAAALTQAKKLLEKLPSVFVDQDLYDVYQTATADDFQSYRRQVAEQIIRLQQALKR